jgi:hypothetical protein
MVVGMAGLAFGIIQLLLVMRLALPFVHVPAALHSYVPGLVTVTDWLITPFNFVINSFDLGQASHELSQFGGVLPVAFANKLDAGVIVAMIGWGIIAGVVILILRTLFRVL